MVTVCDGLRKPRRRPNINFFEATAQFGNAGSWGHLDFHDLVVFAPERQTCQPVLPLYQLVRRPVLGGQNSRTSGEFRACDLPAYRGRRYLYIRVVSDAFVFPRVVPGHDVELAIIFSEPQRRAHACAIFLEGGQRNVFLA